MPREIALKVNGVARNVGTEPDTPLLYALRNDFELNAAKYGCGVVLLNRPEEKPLGTGEGSQGPMVAAIANAVCHATGTRLRDLPFTPQRVKAARA